MTGRAVAMRRRGAAAWIAVVLVGVTAVAARQSAPPAPTPQAAAPGAPSPAVRSGYAGVGGARLYYEVRGTGDTLVLLHGGLSSSVDFSRMMPDLARSFTVVTIDRRGHGRSSDNEAPFAYGPMAADVKAVLDTLSISSAMVIGFSDGGVVGLHLASAYPALVRKLVAIGSSIRLDGMGPQIAETVRSTSVESLAAAAPSVERQFRAINPSPGSFPTFVAKSRDMWLRDPYMTPEQLAGIQAPVLLVAGERDAVRLPHVLEMRALLKAGQLCVLPGATHFVLLERPAILTPIVLQFLRE